MSEGEDCEGVVGAPAFVKWYNGRVQHRGSTLIDVLAVEPLSTAGHPDYQNIKAGTTRLFSCDFV